MGPCGAGEKPNINTGRDREKTRTELLKLVREGKNRCRKAKRRNQHIRQKDPELMAKGGCVPEKTVPSRKYVAASVEGKKMQ